MTALGTVIMFCTGLIPIGTYALPAISGVLLIMIVIEMGPKWAWVVYGAISILSLLLAPDREASLIFVMFFGYYPIVKALLERLSKKGIAWLLKFVIFNAAMVVDFMISIFVLAVPKDSFTVMGIYLPWIFLLLGNLVFLIYDYALSLLVGQYVRQLHRTVSKWLRGKH